MSQAQALLSSLATTASVAENVSDDYIVIDEYLRTLTLPKHLTNLGVETDDDVLRLKFKMPRYIGEVDLSAFSIRINYMNQNGVGDVYAVSDAEVVGSYITFSWLVGPTATEYKGITKFAVCFQTFDSKGYIDREFNTTITSLPVLEGLETDSQAVARYSDILEQWKRELFGAGDTVEANIEAKSAEEQENIAQKGVEVLATIPEDYTTTFNMIQNADRTKADAIICSSEGDVISVVDASDDHVRNLQIFGKTTQVSTTGTQMIPQPYADTTKTMNGVTFTVNDDGSIAIRGTNTATDNVSTYFMLYTGTLDPGTYTYSCAGLPGSCVTNIYYIGDVGTNSTKTFTAVADTDYGFIIRVTAGMYVSAVVYPMLNAGETALEYEPYTGGTSAPNPSWPRPLANAADSGALTTDIYGRNLMPVVDRTAVGITATVQDDGSILYTGTANENAWHVYQEYVFTKSGTYTLSMITENKTEKGSLIQLFTSDGVIWQTWQNAEDTQSLTFNAERGGKIRWCIGVKLDEVVNTTVKLMLNPGSEALDWTPYVEKQTLTVTALNCLPGIPVESFGNYADENGQQWICDEIDFERGVYIQRINTATLASGLSVCTLADNSSWSSDIIRFDFGFIFGTVKFVPMMCDRFPYLFAHDTDNIATVRSQECISTHSVNDVVSLFIDKNRLSSPDVAGLATWLEDNDVSISVILKTPIETALTATEIEAFKALYTNFPNTTVLNDAGAWMKLKYNADTKTYLDRLPKATDEQVWAAVDAWLTAKYGAIAEEASF